MKTLAAAVLMIAVSAWGQTSTSVTGKAWVYSARVDSQSAVAIKSCTDPHYISIYADSGMTIPMANPLWPDRNGDYTIFLSVPCIEVFPSHGHPYEVMSPHKLKPSVTCAGKDCLVSSHIDPCDGWACTKPVETLPQHECKATPDECWRLRKGIDADTFYRALAGLKAVVPHGDGIQDIGTLGTLNCKDAADEGCGIVNTFQQSVDHEYGAGSGVGWQPDKAAVLPQPEWCVEDCRPLQLANGKAAVPVEWKIEDPAPFRVETIQYPDGATATTTQTGTMVVLAREEYSHLQKLRALVVEEEKRLAVKYGANPGFDCSGDLSAMRAAGCFADHYEYKDQFLLIDKGGK